MSPRVRAWAELLRVPALFTVPGDALAGAAAAGARPDRRTLLAICSSLCLYEAGMALNDWADRAEDAVERPHRPLPSGRISPGAALAAAGGLTVAGLALAGRAGRPALAVAGTLATTVWAYDLGLKRTAAGPVAMAVARGLDLALGAAATAPGGGRCRAALPSATVLGAHTLAVTAVSRREAQGGSSAAPLAALATTLLLAWTAGRSTTGRTTPELPAGRRTEAALRLPGSSLSGPNRATTPNRATALNRSTATGNTATGSTVTGRTTASRRATDRTATDRTTTALQGALGAAYAATAARPLLHAVLNPSPPLTQRAVGSGIRAMIPLQAALAARGGGLRTALLTAVLAPAARRFARKVSVT
ncbi:SCO3242 family prenyltransferase [Streptomyces jeddahensis]|uniref:Protoheme IX farnesyltransferase n=1 Tax=Streptomyces jeddahensis TaxID=1716141 RepID=A0A177HHF6_9ACTN|nr:UbiA family prenyltransferase [Streptomyces jeddahensis]OAH10146.1 protoheme IX farnesyltransferase [Streptomyces jeddahensis]